MDGEISPSFRRLEFALHKQFLRAGLGHGGLWDTANDLVGPEVGNRAFKMPASLKGTGLPAISRGAFEGVHLAD